MTALRRDRDMRFPSHILELLTDARSRRDMSFIFPFQDDPKLVEKFDKMMHD